MLWKAVVTLFVPPPLPLLPRGGEPRMAHGIMGACPLKKHLLALAFPSSLGGGEPRMAHDIMGTCPLKKHLPASAFPSSLGGGEPRMAHDIMGTCPLKKHLPASAFPSSLGGGAGVVGQIRSQPFPPTYPPFSISRLSPFSPNTSTQTFKHPFAEIHRPPNYTHLCTETNPI